MKKVAFVFPGQGAQYLNMGKEFYDNYEVARQVFKEAEEILNLPLINICFGKSLLDLSRLEIMLPAILTCSVAAYRVITQKYNIYADFMAGHSLGEYSMLVCSGVISFKDALNIVYKRSILAKQIIKKYDAGMSIVEGIDSDIIDIECRDFKGENKVNVSCYNSRRQVAISGINDSLLRLENILRSYGANVTPLLNSAPFHCDLMWSITKQFFNNIADYDVENPACFIYSNVTGKKYKDITLVKELLTAQLVLPVKWEYIMNELKYEDIDIIVEVGSKGILSTLLREELIHTKICAVSDIKSLEIFENLVNIGKSDQVINKDCLQKMITECMKVVVSTPNNYEYEMLFQSKVVEGYKTLAKLKNLLQKDINNNNEVIYHDVLKIYDEILTIKKSDAVEKEKYIENLSSLKEDQVLKGI